MADTANKAPMSVVVTTSEKLSSLLIQNGRLIFVKDKCRIAFDWNGKRKKVWAKLTMPRPDVEESYLCWAGPMMRELRRATRGTVRMMPMGPKARTCATVALLAGWTSQYT